MRNLPLLLREAERRVNAHVWPNRADTAGHDAHLASIPANRDTDTDLLLIEAADRLGALEAALWDLIDMVGRYPHPTEPEKLTKARRLVLPQTEDAVNPTNHHQEFCGALRGMPCICNATPLSDAGESK